MEKWNALVQKMEAHRDLCFELLRIYLGLGLLAKGIFFISQTEFLSRLMMEAGEFQAMTTMVVHYVALAHITGGLMLVIGMGTRLAAAMQIPVLFGAVFFIHFKEGVFTTGQNLEFSALVLFLLILIFIYGSGRWSLDYSLEHKKAEVEV
ncbi:DoxX family protein [bacterium]|nr:DoxX family protein [bacterium]